MWRQIGTALPMGLVIVLVYLFFLILPVAGPGNQSDRVEFMARSQFAVRAATQLVGLTAAAAGLLSLVMLAIQRNESGRVSCAGLAVLGGVLLLEPGWAVAVAFGLVAAAGIIGPWVSRSSGDERSMDTGA